MARPSSTLCLFLLIFFLLHFATLLVPTCSSTNSFLYGGCSQQKYVPKSPYEYNVDSILASLVNSATYSSYNSYKIMASSRQDIVYGLYQCRGDLSMPECAKCVASAVRRVGNLCPKTCGGAVQLQGCYIKYDNDTFLGVEDKTVVLKKCGPSNGYATEAMAERDAVLSSLLNAGGPFRVGGSGKVQGLIQCVGDLTTGECQDCVAEAIHRLKSDCGTAVYGDMFLAKCYARYSSVGAQVFSKSDNGKSKDRSAKTFAIIVGLLGGVALLVIFLMFIRKIFAGPGGK